MSIKYADGEPSELAKGMLEALQNAVDEELERKRRLGHYAVFWDGEKPVCVGDDAPANP